jgi:hypothetical protein
MADLYQIATKINNDWNSNGHKLPQHLDELRDVALADPISRSAYEYHTAQANGYELCATFALASEAIPRSSAWSHPAGHYCFRFDASRGPDNPGIYLPD